MDKEPSKIADSVYEFPKKGEMNVPLRVYATQKILDEIEPDAFKQGMNVASLPGIVKASIMLPDAHFGYGFPIGGVAAFDLEKGVVSPGGVGFDINCGVRLISTDLTYQELKPKLREITARLFEAIPAGVGSKSRLRVTDTELRTVLTEGAKWAVDNGYGMLEDLEHIEENGRMQGAQPDKCSHKAFERGRPQLGTLGSGNHFLEIQKVEQVFDEATAKTLGIKEGNITVMLHCGSRGFGHQVASDYIRVMEEASAKYGIKLVDRQLACAPINSKEAKDYMGAMFCAVNYAFANRQTITHWVREAFSKVFGEIKMPLIYDVCHNIAKFEEHEVNGGKKTLCVHRKGATRSFGPGRKEIPAAYRSIGQPVIIPGDMGTASYLLLGTKKAEQETFGSTCHGAGRIMSRTQATTDFGGLQIKKMLEAKGQVIFATTPKVLAEEAPDAYKDIDEVIDSVVTAGLSKKVARMVPLGVSKG